MRRTRMTQDMNTGVLDDSDLPNTSLSSALQPFLVQMMTPSNSRSRSVDKVGEGNTRNYLHSDVFYQAQEAFQRQAVVFVDRFPKSPAPL